MFMLNFMAVPAFNLLANALDKVTDTVVSIMDPTHDKAYDIFYIYII